MISPVCHNCGAPVLEAAHVATALRDALDDVAEAARALRTAAMQVRRCRHDEAVAHATSEISGAGGSTPGPSGVRVIVVGYRALIDVVDDAAAQLRGFCSGACERAPQAPESEATQAARCFREAARRVTPVPGRQRRAARDRAA